MIRLPWAAKVDFCDSETVTPQTALEKAAYKTSGYDDGDVGVLYTICAAIDPEDVYAGPGFVASPGQIQGINAALMLCPKHPQAAKWRQAVQRGKAESKLEAQGRLFGSGTNAAVLAGAARPGQAQRGPDATGMPSIVVARRISRSASAASLGAA